MFVSNSILNIALEALNKEKKSIEALITSLSLSFESVVQAIFESKGKLIVTGVGKSAIIAQKIVATLNSTGTIATFLHAADAVHGDLGIVHENDLLLCISKSGNTPEIKTIVPILQSFNNPIIAMTADPTSFLATQSQYLLYTPVTEEADRHNLAPTCSTLVQLALGDALAICLSELKNFQSEDFAKFHPGGSLGKKLLLRVDQLTSTEQCPKVHAADTMQKAILEMTEKRLGATAVINDLGTIEGIITDGDLRRMLLHPQFNLNHTVTEYMTRRPRCIDHKALATEALRVMEAHNITQLLVTQNDQYIGMLHLHDLIKEGLTI